MLSVTGATREATQWVAWEVERIVGRLFTPNTASGEMRVHMHAPYFTAPIMTGSWSAPMVSALHD